MMNDTANIPCGKVTTRNVADPTRLQKQNLPYCDFYDVGNRRSRHDTSSPLGFRLNSDGGASQV